MPVRTSETLESSILRRKWTAKYVKICHHESTALPPHQLYWLLVIKISRAKDIIEPRRSLPGNKLYQNYHSHYHSQIRYNMVYCMSTHEQWVEQSLCITQFMPQFCSCMEVKLSNKNCPDHWKWISSILLNGLFRHLAGGWLDAWSKLTRNIGESYIKFTK